MAIWNYPLNYKHTNLLMQFGETGVFVFWWQEGRIILIEQREKFSELGIKKINIRKIVSEILEKEPVIGIPIDAVTTDLKDWARTLKYNVKLWVITKYAEFKDAKNLIYEFPEEFKPELDTAEESETIFNTQDKISRFEISLLDLINEGLIAPNQKLYMSYKPRNGAQKKYESIINSDGSLLLFDQKFSSPSYAALACIQDAGSERNTVNGWTSWKTESGQLISELREELRVNLK